MYKCISTIKIQLGMIDNLKLAGVYRATIPLSFLQILDLYNVPYRFYESLKGKNRMCELCMHVYTVSLL